MGRKWLVATKKKKKAIFEQVFNIIVEAKV
jgi:hypothetical protein